jgi:hypothetical protein
MERHRSDHPWDYAKGQDQPVRGYRHPASMSAKEGRPKAVKGFHQGKSPASTIRPEVRAGD